MASIGLYRYYNFVDKDPVIDRMRTIIKDEGLRESQVATVSGVAKGTLDGWFKKKVRRPQFATIAAVAAGMGYEVEFRRSKGFQFERELDAAKREEAAKAKAKREEVANKKKANGSAKRRTRRKKKA